MNQPTGGVAVLAELATRSPTIAVIGMEGAGKTVLVTTLAKRLSTIDARGVFLNPQGVKTLKYVEHVWNILQSGDWPPSTTPGEKFELSWKLEIVGVLECDLRLVDVAGQDLRQLFGDEQISSAGSLSGHLQSLAEYCRSADIVLFLLNLRDFIGEGDADRRAADEAAIKSAMDYLRADGRPRRVCLVLTQEDQYRELAREHGGWRELLKHCVPYVFGAHIAVKNMIAFPVAAVAETTVVIDDHGIARRVPKPGFTSAALEKLVKWLTDQVREVYQELQQAVPVRPRRDSPDSDGQSIQVVCPHCQAAQVIHSGNAGYVLECTQCHKSYSATGLEVPCPKCGHTGSWDGRLCRQCGYSTTANEAVPSSWPGTVVGAVVFAVLLLIFGFRSCDSVNTTPASLPAPVLSGGYSLEKGNFFFLDTVTFNGNVKNNGASGRVVVKVWLEGEDGTEKEENFYLNYGESQAFAISTHGKVGQEHHPRWATEVPH